MFLSVLLAFGIIPLEGVEIKEDGWLFPNPARAEKKAIRPMDYTHRIPGAETLVKVYRKKKEDVVFETLEIEGKIYSCQFHIKGKDGQPTTVYAIADMDGDGVFESRFSAGEAPTVPDWIVKHYYEKHPDGVDPGPAADARRTQ